MYGYSSTIQIYYKLSTTYVCLAIYPRQSTNTELPSFIPNRQRSATKYKNMPTPMSPHRPYRPYNHSSFHFTFPLQRSSPGKSAPTLECNYRSKKRRRIQLFYKMEKQSWYRRPILYPFLFADYRSGLWSQALCPWRVPLICGKRRVGGMSRRFLCISRRILRARVLPLWYKKPLLSVCVKTGVLSISPILPNRSPCCLSCHSTIPPSLLWYCRLYTLSPWCLFIYFLCPIQRMEMSFYFQKPFYSALPDGMAQICIKVPCWSLQSFLRRLPAKPLWIYPIRLLWRYMFPYVTRIPKLYIPIQITCVLQFCITMPLLWLQRLSYLCRPILCSSKPIPYDITALFSRKVPSTHCVSGKSCGRMYSDLLSTACTARCWINLPMQPLCLQRSLQIYVFHVPAISIYTSLLLQVLLCTATSIPPEILRPMLHLPCWWPLSTVLSFYTPRFPRKRYGEMQPKPVPLQTYFQHGYTLFYIIFYANLQSYTARSKRLQIFFQMFVLFNCNIMLYTREKMQYYSYFKN
uniref:PCP530R n=1 Tax=African swine fever virus TaxID=10497 RepID=A0A6G7KTW2_ASF